ncbi:polar amino acid transport system substrate-binding protein [Methanolinea mesophila]|uniref:transporter substrate-binding domain-containing protein n=1 Tax=Methanolinea mesophila TaxID=547055 RepID=UPI001AE8F0E8|nr:transporter substrate-binding domain-containing protein [Methanolinea mesophila]MBP1927745.1 polar amino acid transport system substrate-binding protein [Methanolinea mesophila]
MKRTIIVFLLVLAACATLFSGCTTPSSLPESPGATVAASPGGADELKFVTEEYPPFNYVENGTLEGISVDLLAGAYREMNRTLAPGRIRMLPWAEAYQAGLDENDTVILAVTRLPEREALFKWAGPIGSLHQVVFAVRGDHIVINTPGDLDGYRIGVVKDDAALLQLEDLGVNRSHIVTMDNAPELISAVQNRSIDLWVYGQAAGRYFAGKATGDPGYFEAVYTLDSADIYYAFNRNTPDETVGAFQAALDALRNEPDSEGITAYQRIVYRYVGVTCVDRPPVTADQVTSLVNFTAAEMEKDAPGTIARINTGEHPFWDKNNRALYVFVYDTNETIVAEADNPRLVGVNMRGKTDVAGTPFRDRITEKALTEGTGWVDYIWVIPEESGVYYKSAYFRLIQGSDSKPYIVISGMYTPCSSVR